MPELPEVQTVVESLRPRIVGRAILSIEHLRSDIVHPPDVDLRAVAVGRTVTSITRRAKRIVVTLDDNNRFFIHLGMSGRLTIESKSNSIEKHTHLIALLAPAPERTREDPDHDTQQLRFRDPRRFGGIFWIGTAPDRSEANLGPEPLLLKSSTLRWRLEKTKRAIKKALLDQKLIAGLGNIYADESLFLAGIHPLKRADKLTSDEVNRLNRSIKTTLRGALRHRGSTLRDYVDGNGNAGGFQRLFRVYGRDGEPCPRCRAAINRIVVGGRSTHFCPICQPRRRSG